MTKPIATLAILSLPALLTAREPKLWFNEDNEHFYIRHSADEMTDAGCRGMVRTYGSFGEFAGVLYCISERELDVLLRLAYSLRDFIGEIGEGIYLPHRHGQ